MENPKPEPPPTAPEPMPPEQAARPAAGAIAPTTRGRSRFVFLGLREQAPRWQVVLMAVLGAATCFVLWWFVTRGEPEERIMPPSKGLPSPWETFASFHSLWFDRALTRNLLTTLRRVGLGFGLATLVGVPLGILCGCFSRVNAFFLPLTLFGRNIPVAALIPLTLSLFGIKELQKVMFIFIACVAFIISDTARAIGEVRESYVDSAYTLGARRWQIIMKVLVPLALPSVFNSLRLLFSLALGYIMLAEVIKFGGESAGVGDIINVSQRRGIHEHVLLVLLIIPAVALLIDYMLLWIQQQLFPYRYGGSGLLLKLVRAAMHGWEDVKGFVWRRPVPEGILAELNRKSHAIRVSDRAAS